MINKNTKNKSFISAWHYLQDQGVENNSFMLELKNKKLADFSYDKFMNEERTKEQTIELRDMILKEVKENIWFFFREIVRIPYNLEGFKSSNFDNSDLFGSIPFHLTEKSLSLIYLYSKGVNIFLKKPDKDEETEFLFRLFEIYEIIKNPDSVMESFDNINSNERLYDLYYHFHNIIPLVQSPEDFNKFVTSEYPTIYLHNDTINNIFFNVNINKMSDGRVYPIITNFLKVHQRKNKQIIMLINYSDVENFISLRENEIYKLFDEVFLYNVYFDVPDIYDRKILNNSIVYRWN